MSQLPTPHVFVSAVSSDLKSARKVVNEALTQIGCLPVEQSLAGTEYGKIPEMLRRWIDPCQAVIQLVGRDYGGEPPPDTLPNGRPRRSYTQFEYDYAIEQKKKLYVIVCDESFPYDDRNEQEPREKADLQQQHHEHVLAGDYLWNKAQDFAELRSHIVELKLPMDEVRAAMRRQQIRQRRVAAAVVAAVVLLLAAAIYGFSHLGRKADDTSQHVTEVGGDVKDVKTTVAELPDKIDQTSQETVQKLSNPDTLAASIRKQINASAQKQIDAIPQDEKGRWQKIAEIERRRDVQLRRVDDLVNLIQDELQEGATEVFARAVEIVSDAEQGGVDAALAYLESRRPTTLEIARRHAQRAKEKADEAQAERQQRNRTLQALVLEAELRESRFDWSAGLELRQQIADLAPDWFDARNRLGLLMLERFTPRSAESDLRAALKLAETPQKKVIALNNLARMLQDTNRLSDAEPLMRRALELVEDSEGNTHPRVALLLNNLAALLQARNELCEAELLYRRALIIDEQCYGTSHAVVARDLNNLATLLQTTNRLLEAELLMRRTLVIETQCKGNSHPDYATNLNNLGQLLRATNRLTEAEPLVRHALAIDERTSGIKHPNVAVSLNNLAELLRVSNRLSAAEPLYARALAIDEDAFGPEHPKVATRLNNLTLLLKGTDRLNEAEPLIRRVVNIFRSGGPNRPDFATSIDNLAQLLQSTKRLSEAEQLYRCALALHEQCYGAEHPDVAIDLNNLAQLLQATNRLAEAEPLMRRALEIFATGLVADHPNTVVVRKNYRLLLIELGVAADESQRRITNAMQAQGPFLSILAEVERVLGPATPVDEVLAALDEQYRSEGRPAVYFLPADEPIALHLPALLSPTRDSLSSQGLAAYFDDFNAQALALLEAAAVLNGDQPDAAQWSLTNRMNRGAALRDLGALDKARVELMQVAGDMQQDPDTTPTVLGRCHFHLALCESRLGNAAAARLTAERSLQVYDDAPDDAPVPAGLVEQSRQLLADLEAGKQPPPRMDIDVEAELRRARQRLAAAQKLATFPLDQQIAPRLDAMLGPAKSVQQVLDELDRQYREQGKPDVWFLPLDQPISPHLDQLLGSAPDNG